MVKNDKSKTPKEKAPSDDITEMAGEALQLRVKVLQAQKVLKGIQDEATATIAAAQEVFTEIRDTENAKMATEQEKVDAANADLLAFGENMSEKLGVDNALGLLGAAPAARPTPQVGI